VTLFRTLLLMVLFALPARAAEMAPQPAVPAGHQEAIFAGGCFWCMEPPFDKLDGVVSTTSGYIGGMLRNPTYETASSGSSGHTEAMKVVYDPAKVSYEKLLDLFWRNHDPLSKNGQFCDRGSQYRAGIFWLDEAQRAAAEKSKQALTESKRFNQPIVTEITKATEFWPAEVYHQDYYVKNPIRYKFYRLNCGRDARLEELWGPPGS
jgi:peptide-methionine (S)-S-oxide reductase